MWLYSPHATRDSFYRILTDYLDPKLKRAENRLLELRQEVSNGGTASDRRALADQESLVEDLRAFRGPEIQHELRTRGIGEEHLVNPLERESGHEQAGEYLLRAAVTIHRRAGIIGHDCANDGSGAFI